MANPKNIELKQQVVAETVELIDNAASIVVVDSRGLTVAEVTELRKNLRDAGVSMHVIKNTMLRRAVSELGLEIDEDVFKGPSAIAVSKEDVAAPAKILVDAAKDLDNLQLKGGIVEGNPVTVEQLDAVAKLPSREDLLSMVASALQAPISGLAGSLNQVAQSPLRGIMAGLTELADKTDAA